MALGDQRRARRRQEARDRHEPRRQQRGHDPGRAGSARAAWASRRHDRMVALRRAGRIVFGAGIASWHPWRRGRDVDHAGAISAAVRKDRRSPISAPAASRWSRNIAGFRRIGRRRSPGRPRTFTPAAPSAMPRWSLPRRKGEHLLDHGARAFFELLADVDKFDVKRLLDAPSSPSK